LAQNTISRLGSYIVTPTLLELLIYFFRHTYFVTEHGQLRPGRLSVRLLSTVRHGRVRRDHGRQGIRTVLRLRRRVGDGQGERPQGVLFLRGEGLAQGPGRVLAVHISAGKRVSRKHTRCESRVARNAPCCLHLFI